MTGLVITGSVLLFFAILLFSPVVLRFAWSGEKYRASVRYLVIVLDFSPEKVAKRAEKKAERAVKTEYRKQKAEEKKKKGEASKTKAAGDTIKTVWSLVKSSKRSLDIIRKHLVFYRIRGAVAVGGADAHVTALNYARVCTLASNGLAALDSIFVVKEPEISISPDFLREKTVCDIAFRVRIAPWYALAAGAHLLVRFLCTMRRNNAKREKVKGGKRHEPTKCY